MRSVEERVCGGRRWRCNNIVTANANGQGVAILKAILVGFIGRNPH